MTTVTQIRPRILFVDDEATAVKYFERAIGALAPVVTASSVDEGIRLLDANATSLDVLVSDQRMPGRYGNELLRYAKDNYPNMVRILTTAYSEMENTVEAVNEGQIHRYLKKPWEISSLRMELKQALQFAELQRERDLLIREKITITRKQTMANRIGVLPILCSAMGLKHVTSAVECYLLTASRIGVEAPVTDWSAMDYSDLIGAEAVRSSEFGRQLYHAIEHYRQGPQVGLLSQASGHFAAHMQGQLTIQNGRLVCTDKDALVEYLASSMDDLVSQAHANWLAFLLWTYHCGFAVVLDAEDPDWAFSIIELETTPHSAPLAAWIEQF